MLEVTLTKTGTNAFGNTYGTTSGLFNWSLTNSTLAASTWVVRATSFGFEVAVYTNNGVTDSIVDTYSVSAGDDPPWNTVYVYACTPEDSYVTNYNVTIATNYTHTTSGSVGTVIWFY